MKYEDSHNLILTPEELMMDGFSKEDAEAISALLKVRNHSSSTARILVNQAILSILNHEGK